MRNRNSRWLLIILCLGCSSWLHPLYAGSPQAPDKVNAIPKTPSEANWYHVELIVFERPFADENTWGKTNILPDLSQAISLLPFDNSAKKVPVAWQKQPNRYLQGVYRRLGSAQKYQPVAYLSWIQPALQRSRLVAISSGQNSPVTGTVRISNNAPDPVVDIDIAQLYPLPPGVAPNERVRAYLRSSRRIKFDELHYFDHPGFGVLIQVIRR